VSPTGHHWGAVLLATAAALGMSMPLAPDMAILDRPRTRSRCSDGPHPWHVEAKRHDRKMRRRAIAERSRRFNQGRRP